MNRRHFFHLALAPVVAPLLPTEATRTFTFTAKVLVTGTTFGISSADAARVMAQYWLDNPRLEWARPAQA